MKHVSSQLALALLAGLLGYAAGCFSARSFTAPPRVGRGTMPAFSRHLSEIRRRRSSANLPVPATISAGSRAKLAAPFTGKPLSQQTYIDWIRRDPIAAINWYLADGWHRFGDDRASFAQRLKSFSALLEYERSDAYFGERMSWTGEQDLTFELAAGWKEDHGKKLADIIAHDPQGADLMWLTAAANPANGWFETAEWAAELPVDESERSRLIEQLARKSADAGDAAVTAAAFAEHPNVAVYDRARILLLTNLLRTSQPAAAVAWDSLSSSSAKLAAAAQVMISPDISQETKALVAEWVRRSDALGQTGEAWGWLVNAGSSALPQDTK